MTVKSDDSSVASVEASERTSAASDLLEIAGRRGVASLMPYLWTLVFIVAILALIYARGLDWWVAGFGGLVTLSLLMMLFVIRQIVEAPPKEVKFLAVAAMWFFMLLFGATLTLFISSTFFGQPLDFRPISKEEDEGAAVIRDFYKRLDKREFGRAWDLIHERRKEEIKANSPSFNEKDFADTYKTTREHTHLQIERIPGSLPIDRSYWVSFAVSDDLPMSSLYRSRTVPVKDWFEGHSLDRERLVGIVVNDVKRRFIVPAEREQEIVDFVMMRRFESLFRPDIVYDIGREMKLADKLGNSASPDRVWRYFVQVLHLQEDQPGAWKITGGLYPRIVDANYEPSATAP